MHNSYRFLFFMSHATSAARRANQYTRDLLRLERTMNLLCYQREGGREGREGGEGGEGGEGRRG